MASDRATLLKAFDESRTGVRGLVESGISSVPDLFVHPDPYASSPLAPPVVSIPVVDLSLPTPAAAAAAAEAARRWGFFHLVNHHRTLAVPDDYPARALAAVRAFHELPAPERAAHYGRGGAAGGGGVSYYSNFDLHRSPVTSWRDSIRVNLDGTDPVRMPHACLADVPEWGDAHATAVASAVMRLLSEGLGLAPPALEETTSLQGKVMVCQNYPACPEPERTMGIVAHTDPGVLTVLAQDAVGGLQVKPTDEAGRSHWVDVKPVPGALVINVGDILQIMSNDEYTSVEHRVIMNTCKEARVSIATFFSPGKKGDSVFYGPLPELVSSENPPRVRLVCCIWPNQARQMQVAHVWLPGGSIGPGPADAKGTPQPASCGAEKSGVSPEPGWRGASASAAACRREARRVQAGRARVTASFRAIRRKSSSARARDDEAGTRRARGRR